MKNLPTFDEFVNEGFFSPAPKYVPKPTSVSHVAGTFFHGTSPDNARKIIGGGFVFGHGGGLGNLTMPAVYLALNFNAAKVYATPGFGSENDPFAVLQVEIDGKFIVTQQESDVRAIMEFCDQHGIEYTWDERKPGALEFLGQRLNLNWPAITDQLRRMGVDGFVFKDGLARKRLVHMVTNPRAIKSIAAFKYGGPEQDGLGKKFKKPREPWMGSGLRNPNW